MPWRKRHAVSGTYEGGVVVYGEGRHERPLPSDGAEGYTFLVCLLVAHLLGCVVSYFLLRRSNRHEPGDKDMNLDQVLQESNALRDRIETLEDEKEHLLSPVSPIMTTSLLSTTSTHSTASEAASDALAAQNEDLHKNLF